MPVWLENYKRATGSFSGLYLRPRGVHLPLIDGLNSGHLVSESVSPLYRCWYAPCKNELSGGDTCRACMYHVYVCVYVCVCVPLSPLTMCLGPLLKPHFLRLISISPWQIGNPE